MTYTFIAAIADGRLAGEDYRERTERQLDEHGLRFSDGDLKRGDDLIGFYRFLDRDQGARVMPMEAQRALVDPGPFGGTAVGYLNWTHAVDQRVGHAQMAPAILAVCRGIVARTDNGRFKQAIREINFLLSNLVGNHGFADGGALISRDDDYLRYVQRQAHAAIAAAGLSGHVGRFDTRHNPIRLVGDLRLHGRVVDEPERELAGHQVRIWALDLACLADREFWSD